MASRPKRATLARAAVGLVALAGPLFASSAAQAAIAGAPQPSFTGTPSLLSATIDSTTPNLVHFCFNDSLDQTISLFNTEFSLYFYAVAQRETAGSVAYDSSHPNCVLARFVGTGANGGADLAQGTVASVVGGSVYGFPSGSGSSVPNYADSVPLTGSNTHTGTSGNESVPDLAGVQPPVSGSPYTYTYVFNKQVQAPTANDFYVVPAAGSPSAGVIRGTSATQINGNTVAVTFPSTATNTAVIAGVFEDAVSEVNTNGYNNLESAIVSNAQGSQEANPYLTSATINCSNGTINYTFSAPVNTPSATVGSAPNAGYFLAEFADGSSESGTSIASYGTTSSSTLTVGFPHLADFCEFGVIAAVNARGAYAANSSTSVEPSSAPIGDNAGAFAQAFTTAPDVFGVTVTHGNASTGTADLLTIRLDDRLYNAHTHTSMGAQVPDYGIFPADFTYYSQSGTNPVSGTTNNPSQCTVPNSTAGGPAVQIYPYMSGTTTGQQNGPGPETITCTFGINSLSGVYAVGFANGAFIGTEDENASPNGTSVAQIDATLSSSAIVKAYKANLAKIAKQHKKSHRKSHKK
jgi:hypothetical protein